jgi:hypothetical protein
MLETKAIDRELEEASSDFIAEIEGLGEKFRLYRSIMNPVPTWGGRVQCRTRLKASHQVRSEVCK